MDDKYYVNLSYADGRTETVAEFNNRRAADNAVVGYFMTEPLMGVIKVYVSTIPLDAWVTRTQDMRDHSTNMVYTYLANNRLPYELAKVYLSEGGRYKIPEDLWEYHPGSVPAYVGRVLAIIFSMPYERMLDDLKDPEMRKICRASWARNVNDRGYTHYSVKKLVTEAHPEVNLYSVSWSEIGQRWIEGTSFGDRWRKIWE